MAVAQPQLPIPAPRKWARDGHHFGWRQVPPRIVLLRVQLQLIMLLGGRTRRCTTSPSGLMSLNMALYGTVPPF